MKRHIIIILLLFTYTFALSQQAFKIMAYNLLNFGNYTSYCTQANNSHTYKAQYLKTIVNNQQPDILAVCELSSNIYYMNYILGNSLNTDGTTKWAKIEFTNMAGSDIVNGIFYDKTKFSYDQSQAIDAVNTGVRDINIYKLKCLNSRNDAYIHIVTAHLKAGSTNSDKVKRAEMTNLLMDRLSNYSDKGNNFVILGDFNVYTGYEQAFQNLINPQDPITAFFDPIDKIGNWNNNSSYKNYHSQSTHSDSDNSCFASGGLDDRFDFILVSSSLLDGSKNIKYKNNSYLTLGQDGLRYNSSINYPTNSSLPSNVISALYNMSDHLPIIAEFTVESSNSFSSLSSDPGFYAKVVNPTGSELNYKININSSKKLNVNLYTAIGEKVFTQQIFAEHGNSYSHDISKLPNGIYILTFEGEGTLKSYKIIKNE